MAPSNKEQLQALSAEDVKPTEAHISLAKFLTENGPVEVSAEQAYAFIMGHRIWQSSEERKLEKEALKGNKAEEAEAKRVEREAARAEKAEAKAAAAAAREAKKAAKAAEAADSDEDLSDVDDEGLNDGETAAPKRRRRKAAETVESGEF